MRRIWSVLIGVLILILVANGAFAYFLAARYNAQLKVEMQENRSLSAENERLIDQLDELETGIEGMQAKHLAVEEELEALSATAAELEESAQESRRTIGELQRELKEYESALETSHAMLSCGFNDLSFDYRDNESVSQDLRPWVEEIMGPVHHTEWYPFWTDETIFMQAYSSGENVTFFVVFFGNVPMESINGIFWIAGGCWLDRPNDDLIPSPNGSI